MSNCTVHTVRLCVWVLQVCSSTPSFCSKMLLFFFFLLQLWKVSHYCCIDTPVEGPGGESGEPAVRLHYLTCRAPYQSNCPPLLILIDIEWLTTIFTSYNRSRETLLALHKANIISKSTCRNSTIIAILHIDCLPTNLQQIIKSISVIVVAKASIKCVVPYRCVFVCCHSSSLVNSFQSLYQVISLSFQVL